MYKKLKWISIEQWLLTVLFGVIGLFLGMWILKGIQLISGRTILDFLYPVCAVAIFIIEFFLVLAHFLSEFDEVETVTEFEQRFPERYQQLCDQDPKVSLHRYCKKCASEMLVTTNLITLEYKQETGEPFKQKLRIFCPYKCPGSDHNIILINQKKKRLQDEDLEVVDPNEEGNNQLPAQSESLG